MRSYSSSLDGASINRRYIDDALDNTLVTPRNYHTTQTEIHLLRLRMNVIARILFQDVIVVPQGWTMDSLPFFKILSEVTSATENLRKEAKPLEGIDVFSPFEMECHLENISSYPQALAWYLNRTDCHWSGMPDLKDDTEGRLKLAELIKPSADDLPHSLESFRYKAIGVLQSELVADIWTNAIRYFATFPERVIKGDTRDLYIKTVQQCLSVVEAQAFRQDEKAEVLEMLKIFKRELDNVKTNAASFVLKLADSFVASSPSSVRPATSHCDCGGVFVDVVRYISTFSQMHAAAHATKSDTSAPARPITGAEGSDAGDLLAKFAFPRIANHDCIYFGHSIALQSPIAERLKKVEVWSELWKNVIRLAHNKDWRDIITAIKSSRATPQRIFDSKDFRKMEDKLKSHCPELVIENSLSDRFLFKLSDDWKKRLSDSFDRGAFPGAGLALGAAGHMIGPHLHFAATLIPVTAITCIAEPMIKPIVAPVIESLLPGIKKYDVNPFRDSALFSTRSSLFRP